MTIQTTELLQLLTKAKQLDLTVEVCEDKYGDYVIKIFKLYERQFEPYEVVITQKGESNWCKGDYNFDTMMSILDEKLEEQKQKEIKAEKRKELIARLTDEEKELLGVK